MPTFAYSGRTRGGQTVSGERVADSMDAATAALRRDQINVTRITPAKAKVEAAAKKEKGGRSGKKVAAKNLAVFTRQFSVMIDAGLPLVQCLEILGSQEEDKNFAFVIMATRTDVTQEADVRALVDEATRRYGRIDLFCSNAGIISREGENAPDAMWQKSWDANGFVPTSGSSRSTQLASGLSEYSVRRKQLVKTSEPSRCSILGATKGRPILMARPGNSWVNLTL